MIKTKIQVVMDFGMVPPPLSIHNVDPELFAASWACLRETLVLGRVPRYFKEAVASGTSEANQCSYCVDAHSTMFDIYRPTEEKQFPAKGHFSNWELVTLRTWASSCFLPEQDRPVAPFPLEFQAEIVGTAVYFHYLTRMVTIYLGDDFVPKPLKWLVVRMMPLMRIFMGFNDKRDKKAGISRLRNIPSTGGPDWADQENIRVAFAQFQAVTDNKIMQILTKPIIDFIDSFLAKWQGLATGLGSNWLNSFLEELPSKDEQERQKAKYLLLVIGSPYMVTNKERRALEKTIGKKDLFMMTAWVSMRAALRTGTLISGDKNV